MKDRYAESLLLISTTTTDPERTYPWGKTRLKHVLCNRPKSGRSWLFAKWVDCTTATNGKQPKASATYSRFLVDRFAASALARPQIPRVCLQTRYSNRSPRHGSHRNQPARHTEFSLGTIGTVENGLSVQSVGQPNTAGTKHRRGSSPCAGRKLVGECLGGFLRCSASSSV